MADLSITAGNVSCDTTVNVLDGIWGETVTQGDLVYQDASDSNKWKKAMADSTAAKAAIKGVAISSGTAGQRGFIKTGGTIDMGGTLTVATVYALSSNDGKFGPVSDRLSGEFMSVLGVATAVNSLQLGIINSGVAKP